MRRCWSIACCRCLEVLQDGRFLLLGGLAVGLTLLGTVFSLREYSGRLQGASKLAAAAERESSLDGVIVVRMPSRLQFVRDGGETQFPPAAVVLPGFVDVPKREVTDEPFVGQPLSLDWTFVVGYVLSFLALVVTYDGVIGEKERGTLRLVSALGASRLEFLLGQYLGSVLCLVPVLLAGLLGSLLLVGLDGRVGLGGAEAAMLALAAALSVAFLLVMGALGTMVSTFAQTKAQAIILVVVSWVLFCVLVPSGGGLAVDLISTGESGREVEDAYRAAWMKFADGNQVSSAMLTTITDKELSPAQEAAEIARAQRALEEEHLRKVGAYQGEVLEIRARELRRSSRRALLLRSLGLLSPAGAYSNIMNEVTGSGFAGHSRFVAGCVEYMRAVSPDLARLRVERRAEARVWGPSVSKGERKLQGVTGVSYRAVKLDRAALPRFSPRTPDVISVLRESSTAISVLVGFGIAFLGAAFFRFQVYDLR